MVVEQREIKLSGEKTQKGKRRAMRRTRGYIEDKRKEPLASFPKRRVSVRVFAIVSSRVWL